MNDDRLSGTFASVAEPPVFEIGTFVVPSWLRLAARLFATSLDEKFGGRTAPRDQPPARRSVPAARVPRYRRGIADSWLHLLIEVRRPYN